MIKYTLLVMLISQIVFASEKDSLITPSVFKQKLNLLNSFSDEDDCDACGCSASGGSMGFASIITSNFIGLRYFNQSYKTNDGLYSNSPWLDQNFNTIQLWSRIPLSEKIQASVQIPYHYNTRELEEGNQSISGIGDITLLGLYRLVQSHADSLVYKHSVYLGGGLKIPTGAYDESNNGSVNPSFQLGTGSWDYFLLTEYTLRKNKWGLNNMINYIIKTKNKKDYQFGNQFNYGSTLFYLLEINNFTIAPQVGIAGEVYDSNELRGLTLKNTSGDILFSKIGFEMGKNKISLGAHAFVPIQQNLTGGLVEANYRWNVYFNYSL